MDLLHTYEYSDHIHSDTAFLSSIQDGIVNAPHSLDANECDNRSLHVLNNVDGDQVGPVDERFGKANLIKKFKIKLNTRINPNDTRSD